MSPPAVMSEFHLILIVFLMLLGGLLIGWILHATHCAEKHLPENQRKPWFIFAAVIALIVLMKADVNVPVRLTPAEKMLAARTTPPMTWQQALDQCPPPGPGLTSQIIFTIETESDTQPRVTGCSRIAEQQYIVGARK